MYFLKPISDEVRLSQSVLHNHKRTMKLMLVSLFASIAAILQAAGGFLPGIGYFISPLATAPILVCCMFSIPSGVMSYVLTNMLLFIIQPTELIIFPFTTGMLGLGIGASFYFFRRRISIIAAGSILLTLGLMMLLYIFQFPVLGPVSPNSFSITAMGAILLFTSFYSWLWVEFALGIIKRVSKMSS